MNFDFLCFISLQIQILRNDKKNYFSHRRATFRYIEEEKALSKHHLQGRVIVIDCVTLWGTNFFFDQDSNVDLALQELKEEFDRFTAQEATFIFVTNEIGMGGVAENTIQRRFTDMQGWVNQYIAEKADEVVLMVSGIGVKVKG